MKDTDCFSVISEMFPLSQSQQWHMPHFQPRSAYICSSIASEKNATGLTPWFRVTTMAESDVSLSITGDCLVGGTYYCIFSYRFQNAEGMFDLWPMLESYQKNVTTTE